MKKTETRQVLIDALYDLAMDQPLDKITVRQISEKAGVTSQTFYNHFNDKYDMVLNVHKEKVNRLLKAYREGGMDWNEFIDIYLTSYETNSKFVVNAFKNVNGNDSYSANTGRYMCECLKEEVRNRIGEEPDLNLQLLIKCYASGVINLIAYWLTEDTIVTKADVKQVLMDSLPEKLRAIFKEDINVK